MTAEKNIFFAATVFYIFHIILILSIVDTVLPSTNTFNEDPLHLKIVNATGYSFLQRLQDIRLIVTINELFSNPQFSIRKNTEYQGAPGSCFVLLWDSSVVHIHDPTARDRTCNFQVMGSGLLIIQILGLPFNIPKF